MDNETIELATILAADLVRYETAKSLVEATSGGSGLDDDCREALRYLTRLIQDTRRLSKESRPTAPQGVAKDRP